MKARWEQCALGVIAVGCLVTAGCGRKPEKAQTIEKAPLSNTEKTSPPDATKNNPSLAKPKAAPYRSNELILVQKSQSSAATSSGLPTSKVLPGGRDAIAFFGEAAPRNFRGSATYGIYINALSRFKVSGEYLTQHLNFDYASGHHKKWVSQLAVGGEYQYLLNNPAFTSVEMGAAYSHAFNRHVKATEVGTGETVKRHIGGSNAALSFIGTTVRLWSCAFLSAAANYDWVRFERKYQHDKLSNGFGGSIDFVQQFAKDFSLNLGAEFRQPFNSYQGALNWNHRFSKVNLDIGIFGNLTDGHEGVRDVRTVGMQLGISFGPKPTSCGRSVNISKAGNDCYARQYCDVSQWVSTPAVYVPVVLAIADQAVHGCTDLPVRIGTLPSAFSAGLASGGNPEHTYIDTAQYFAGSGLTYSVSYDSALLPAGNAITIDPVTGILDLYNFAGQAVPDYFIVVTASNACGAASFTELVIFGTP